MLNILKTGHSGWTESTGSSVSQKQNLNAAFKWNEKNIEIIVPTKLSENVRNHCDNINSYFKVVKNVVHLWMKFIEWKKHYQCSEVKTISVITTTYRVKFNVSIHK